MINGMLLGYNVSDLDAVRAALGSAARIDVLVNSAGIAHVGTVQTTARPTISTAA